MLKTAPAAVVLPRLAAQHLREHRKRQNTQRLALDEAWREHGLVSASIIGTPIEPRNINRLIDLAEFRRLARYRRRRLLARRPGR